MLISVIIPIYNVEKYLDECISSVVNQTYKNLEIILVDDGSTDSCPNICDQWKTKDKRIKVIHKKNNGLGMARNTGIENATGEYVCFFDSDDYVSTELIEHAQAKTDNDNVDVIVFGLTKVGNVGEIIDRRIPNPEKSVYCGDEVQKSFLPDMIGANPSTGRISFLAPSACTAMYSMKLIQKVNWRFVSERDVISEDIYSLLMLYRYVKKVIVLKESLYYYRDNDTSLSRIYRRDRFEQTKKFYHKSMELCCECGYTDEVKKRFLSPFLGNTIATMKQEISVQTDRKNALNRIKNIIDDPLLQDVVNAKEHDKVRLKIGVLLWSIRKKYYRLCFVLLFMQNNVIKRNYLLNRIIR